MPAIITHDTFGNDFLRDFNALDISTTAERDAFLLGNQGPDPLFYAVADPLRLMNYLKLGNTMHHEKTPEVLAAFKDSIEQFEGFDRRIATAYACGFLCHYALDVSMHPLVYWWQHSLCNAGVEGLSDKDGSEVHAVIESEFDEMVLWTRKHQTVKEFKPYTEILRATDETLEVISKMYEYVCKQIWGISIPEGMFTACVHCFRAVQRVFYSKDGMKRELLGKAEELVRPFSFMRAMSHRAQPLEDTFFANSEREEWTEPATGAVRTDSFWMIFEQAQQFANELVTAFVSEGFTAEKAAEFTRGRNFDGNIA